MLVNDLVKSGKRLTRTSFELEREVTFQEHENYLAVKSESSCVYMAYSKTIAKPYPEKPSEGCFQILLDKTKKNDILMNFLHRLYVQSKCIATEELCIKFSQEVYCINIDIYPVQTDGNLFKLCVEGINRILKILEIKTFFIPKYQYFCSIENCTLADPTEMEIAAANWTVTMVMRSTRELVYFEKAGTEVAQEELALVLNRVFFAPF